MTTTNPNLDYQPETRTNAMTAPAPAHSEHHDEIGAPPPVPRVGVFRMLLGLMVAGAAVGGAFYAGWSPRVRQNTALAEESERIKTALPRVTTTLPRSLPAETTTVLPGDVEAIEETTLYPRTTGYVKRWMADLGSTVEEGQLLAEISTPDVDAQLQKTVATLAESEATLERAIASSNLADVNLRRVKSLVEKNASSQQQLDEAEGMAAVAKANIRVAESTIAANKAEVTRITELQSFSKITAPFRGTITARHIDVGQLVTPGNGADQALFQIARTDVVRVFLNVPQMYAFSVKKELAAQVLVREKPNTPFNGKVYHTAAAIDPQTRTLRTEVRIENKDNALLTGSYVQVRLNVLRDNPPLLVPASALVFDSDGTRVAVVDGSQEVRLRSVSVEGDFGPDVGISRGIAATDQVVTNPGDRMADGLKVSVDQPATKVAGVTPTATRVGG